MLYKIRITEYLTKMIYIKSNSEYEALVKAKELYDDALIILDSDNFEGKDIEIEEELTETVARNRGYYNDPYFKNNYYNITGEDEFLDEENSYQRLKAEFLEHGKLIIAYDIDSTVFDYHNKGETYEQVKQLLRDWRDNAYFIVFTSSEEDRFPFIKEMLEKENLPYDSINEDAPFIPFKGRKVYYNVLLDDRAGLKQTYTELKRLHYECILNKEENDNDNT